MSITASVLTVDSIRQCAHPLTGSPSDLSPLLDQIGDAPYVLLGEASHGTHEFYKTRCDITRRLISEKGFRAVAIEGDWPDAYRVHNYLQGRGSDRDAAEALQGFKRFPSWMWRNADVLDFVGWARAYNDNLAADTPAVGFFGLDLYSMHASMDAVIQYLESVDPTAAARARSRYACFDEFGDDPQAYGYAAGLGISESCENEAIRQVLDLHERAMAYVHRDGQIAAQEFFSAEQNARLVKNAELYYRTMFRNDASSWNVRDAHMAQTFTTLVSHLQETCGEAKIVVWAHNSHLGDARATHMAVLGEWNLGQLLRESYGSKCRSVGFTTHTGTVTAASDWGAPAEVKQVRPSRADSYEGLFHDVGIPAFQLSVTGSSSACKALEEPMLERAIGVVYKPDTELSSHYFMARMADQFDAVIHFDRTRAVEPLEAVPAFVDLEPAETFPSGI